MTGYKIRISFISRQEPQFGAFVCITKEVCVKLVKVKKSFYDECKKHGVEKELLLNEGGRPCVLIVRLPYGGRKRDFVVPLRSNISGTVPRNQYFSLPPNSNTQTGNSHGIHYIKLFPITTKYIDKYAIDKDAYKVMIKSIIDANESAIVKACKRYLVDYEKGNRNPYTPNIDGIIMMLEDIHD